MKGGSVVSLLFLLIAALSSLLATGYFSPNKKETFFTTSDIFCNT